jgi:DNA polymerase-3 subunit delta'
VEFLKISLNNNKVASAYIFQGPKDIGKFSVAKYFASLLIFGNDSENVLNIEVKSSGDLQILEKEEGKQNISIEQVRVFIKNLNLSSFKNRYKVGIIKEADSLSLKAANALLKTLEEPADNVVIILLTTKSENLLKTIYSRSQIITFYPVPSEDIYDYLLSNYKVDRNKAKELSRLSLGRPALAVKMLEDNEYYDKMIEQAKLFLSFLELNINDRIIAFEKYFGKKNIGQVAKQKALELLENWSLALRDCLFSAYNQLDLISFELLKDKLVNIEDSRAINIFKELEKAKKYLEANVNANAVLIEFLINI